MINFLALIPGLGALKAIAIAAAITSLVATGVGIERYYAGKKAGVSQDKKRSDAVIDKLRHDAQNAYDQIMASYRSLENSMNSAIKEKQREYDKAKAKHQEVLVAERATAAADSDILRKRFESGPATGCSSNTTQIPATPSSGDAPAIGDVLDDLLRRTKELAGAAEGHAESVRTLHDAWRSVEAIR
jgi:hypothetical protein